MIPMKLLAFEQYQDEDRKHRQRYNFLYDLELKEVERPSISQKTVSVGITINTYSSNATPHEPSIIHIIGVLLLITFISSSLS